MYFEGLYGPRARYEELLKEAGQERLAGRLRGQRPSVLHRILGRILTHLGHWLVQWGTALQPQRRSTTAGIPAEGAVFHAQRP